MKIKKIECKECLTSYPETLIPDGGVCVYCKADAAEKATVPVEKEDTPTSTPQISREEAAQRELALRALSRKHVLPFVERFNPDYMAGWVHKDICQRLERFSKAVEDGESPRLMLFMPPRHGKSTLASVAFPAWRLGKHPNPAFIICSYSGSVARTSSIKVRGRL